MEYDLTINHDELTKDRKVNIEITNCKSALWQISGVHFLISLTNMISPVKFNIYFT